MTSKRKSQVTTGHGDEGMTMALDGKRYSKAHPIMECVGALDELRASTALSRLLILREKPRDWKRIAAFLEWLLHAYFPIGSVCSDPLNTRPEYHPYRIAQAEIAKLEAEQKQLEAQTPLPKQFIVSASNLVSAQIDLTCTVARRLERSLARLREEFPEMNQPEVLTFVNRLSDFLFILARYVERGEHAFIDYSHFTNK